MTDHSPNRPLGGTPPPDRDRPVGTPPPEHRGSPPPVDRGNSAMALIVGALAVALIIGAFFWFAGDTQDDTAVLDQPVTTQQDTAPQATEPPATETQPIEPQATEEPATGTEQDTGQTGTQQ